MGRKQRLRRVRVRQQNTTAANTAPVAVDAVIEWHMLELLRIPFSLVDTFIQQWNIEEFFMRNPSVVEFAITILGVDLKNDPIARDNFDKNVLTPMKRQPTRLPDGEKDFAFRFGYQPDDDDLQQSIHDYFKFLNWQGLPKERHLVQLCVYLRSHNHTGCSREELMSNIESSLASVNTSMFDDDDENSDSKPAAVIDYVAADKSNNNDDNNNSSSSSSSSDNEVGRDKNNTNIEAVRNYIHEYLFAGQFETFFAQQQQNTDE